MSAAMIRTGGIMALLTVPIVLVLGLLIVAGLIGGGFGNPDGTAVVRLLTPLLYLVFIASAVFVFWTTRGLFKALGYAAADGCFVISACSCSARLSRCCPGPGSRSLRPVSAGRSVHAFGKQSA